MKYRNTWDRRKKGLLIVCAFLLCAGAWLLGRSVIVPVRESTSIVEEDTINEEQRIALESVFPEEYRGERQALDAAKKGKNCPVSFFLADLNNLDPEETVKMLDACQVSILSIPLVWSQLEPEEGVFTPAVVDELLAPYVEAGFRFIFLLDGGGRQIADRNGKIVANSLPEWVLAREDTSRQCDFLDREDVRYGLSYSNVTNQELYLTFCLKTVEYFGNRYADRVVGFSPCVMNEFEIKYPQTLYAWTDFSLDALGGFREYLRAVYGTAAEMNTRLETSYAGFSSVSIPVISYNNTIVSGTMSDDPLFADWQRYREDTLISYVTPAFEMIREKGYKTVAYFGQTLSGQDAIYATGVVTRLADQVDIAVIDFNFYDGYGEVYDCMVPAFLVNYVKNAGYPCVWAGLYFERIPYLEHQEVLQDAVNAVAADGLAEGFEIGGIAETFWKIGQKAKPQLTYGINRREEKPRIAIYAGEWNFYKSHGEQIRYYNYFSDALIQMYRILRFELQEPVDVLCDAALISGAAEKYELLVLPGQFYVDPIVREAVEAYAEAGGKILMDFRFGEWDEKGSASGGWSDACFGIGAREALRTMKTKLVAVEDVPIQGLPELTVRSLYPGVSNLYAMAPLENSGAKALYRDDTGRYYGLCTEKTVVLSFQPQIQYKYAESEEERQTVVELLRSVVNYLLPAKTVEQ